VAPYIFTTLLWQTIQYYLTQNQKVLMYVKHLIFQFPGDREDLDELILIDLNLNHFLGLWVILTHIGILAMYRSEQVLANACL